MPGTCDRARHSTQGDKLPPSGGCPLGSITPSQYVALLVPDVETLNVKLNALVGKCADPFHQESAATVLGCSETETPARKHARGACSHAACPTAPARFGSR